MKKINLKNLKSDLDKYNIDNTHKEVILNQANLYNDTLALYKAGNVKATYILYQLSLAISKELSNLKKSFSNDESKEDDFMKFKNKFEK